MVGALFRQRRESLHISQAELARRVGIDPSALNRIESGQLTGKPQTLAALSRELDIPAKIVFDAILNGYVPDDSDGVLNPIVELSERISRLEARLEEVGRRRTPGRSDEDAASGRRLTATLVGAGSY